MSVKALLNPFKSLRAGADVFKTAKLNGAWTKLDSMKLLDNAAAGDEVVRNVGNLTKRFDAASSEVSSLLVKGDKQSFSVVDLGDAKNFDEAIEHVAKNGGFNDAEIKAIKESGGLSQYDDALNLANKRLAKIERKLGEEVTFKSDVSKAAQLDDSVTLEEAWAKASSELEGKAADIERMEDLATSPNSLTDAEMDEFAQLSEKHFGEKLSFKDVMVADENGRYLLGDARRSVMSDLEDIVSDIDTSKAFAQRQDALAEELVGARESVARAQAKADAGAQIDTLYKMQAKYDDEFHAFKGDLQNLSTLSSDMDGIVKTKLTADRKLPDGWREMSTPHKALYLAGAAPVAAVEGAAVVGGVNAGIAAVNRGDTLPEVVLTAGGGAVDVVRKLSGATFDAVMGSKRKAHAADGSDAKSSGDVSGGSASGGKQDILKSIMENPLVPV